MAGTKLGQEKQAAARTGLTHEEWKARRESGLRWCYHCRCWKAMQQFPRDKSRPDGIANLCGPCNGQRTRRSRYGVTDEQLAALPGADGVCPICQRAGLALELDHNHATGKARGLLCSRCNGGLGLFLDDPTMLAKASAYLEKHDG